MTSLELALVGDGLPRRQPADQREPLVHPATAGPGADAAGLHLVPVVTTDAQAERETSEDGQCTVLSSRHPEPAAPAARLWDLPTWATEARQPARRRAA